MSKSRNSKRIQKRAVAQPTLREVTATAPVVSTAAQAPSEEAIRARAYELYLARSGSPGRAIDDWLEAERQLAARL